MTILLVVATVAVSVLMLLAWLPEIRKPGQQLRRWSHVANGYCSVGINKAIEDVISAFAGEHNLQNSEVARLLNMKSRPGMMPVTLLLHPQLVKREKNRFVRGHHLSAVIATTGVSALVLPPLAGIALHDIRLCLPPLLNMAVFFTGLQLIRQTYSDMNLLNILITGKSE